MHIRHGIPARAAVQALQANLGDIVHAQVAVQGEGEIPGYGVGVAHGAIDPQLACGQRHVHPRGEGPWPPGAAAFVIRQMQGQADSAGLGLHALGTPGQVARKAVLG